MKKDELSAKILAIRPYSLGNSVILVLIAASLAYADGSFYELPTLLCLVFALTMQCVANLVNDYCDAVKGADRSDRLGPQRVTSEGLLSHKDVKRGIAYFTTAAILSGIGILLWALHHGALVYGGWELILTGVACVVFAYLYTAGPWALAYHGLGDVAVVIFFGLVPIGFTYYIQTGVWTQEVIVASLATGLVIDTMLMLNNFRDYNEDKISHKHTVVVLFGRSFGKWAYLGLGVVAYLLCLVMAWWGDVWVGILSTVYLIFHLRTWLRIVKIDHGSGLNECLGKTGRNIIIFGFLLALGILLG